MEKTLSMDISFIIINYNTRHYLEPCLASIKRHITGLNYEIIVVDNASKDDSVDFTRQHYPNIKLILNDQNYGFAKANNLAAEIAEGDYLFLLNADTVIVNDGLSKAVNYMKDNQISVLGPKLLNADGTLQISFQRKNTLNKHILDVFSLAFPVKTVLKRFRNISIESPTSPCKMGFLIGAALLIDAEVVRKFGLFDESYFFTGEERDFCLKILREHKKIIYFPEFEIIHFGGSGNPHSTFHMSNWFKSSCTLAKNHGSLLKLILIRSGLSLFFLNTSIILLVKYFFSQHKNIAVLPQKYFYLFLWSIGCFDEKRLV